MNTIASLNPLHSYREPHTTRAPLPSSMNEIKLKSKEEKALWEVSKNFETLLVNEMFKSMRTTLEGDKLIGENTGTKIFKDFLNTERSEIASKNSNFGIATAIYKENIKFL